MFVDIHSHALPGIDDGAEDEAEALEMLKLAAHDKTLHIVVTPHFASAADVHAKTTELKKQAALNNIDINIYPGAEVMINPDTPELIESGKLTTINASRYILVELPIWRIPQYAPDILYQMQLQGLIPIIAHPERYDEVIKNISLVREYMERGMLIQINAGSLTGMFGRKVKKTAMKLLKMKMVHFVASDAHSCRGRSPELSKVAALVEKKFGEETMQQLFYSNGMAVLEDRAL